MIKLPSVGKKLTASEGSAAISALICGLAVHIYKFTNTLPNGDALYNFYDPQNIVASGRWFLSVACAPSSFFDLPWVEGMLSLLYIALTAVVVCRIFNIQNRIAAVLAGCLLASYPGVNETFFTALRRMGTSLRC